MCFHKTDIALQYGGYQVRQTSQEMSKQTSSVNDVLIDTATMNTAKQIIKQQAQRRAEAGRFRH